LFLKSFSPAIWIIG